MYLPGTAPNHNLQVNSQAGTCASSLPPFHFSSVLMSPTSKAFIHSAKESMYSRHYVV